MSRPSRIKTSKDAYDEGFQVGRHPSTAGAWPDQSDFNTTPRDPLVDAWTRGWSDGNKEREGSRVPLWATNPPRKTMKRRKTPSIPPSLKRAFNFFREHAGYIVGERAVGALQLAKAERDAANNGWRVGWEPDEDGDGTGKPGYAAILYDEDGKVLGSLGGIDTDRGPYARVVEAELALEALKSRSNPKRPKHRRRVRRGGRVMTVTTSSRVVKTTRMNPRGKAKITDAYRKTFFEHYLIAALWSSNDNSDESGGEPLDKNYGIEDFAPDSFKKLRADCDRFIDKYAPVLAALDADGRETADQAGHDLWLTRNGHGVGFWDRGLGEIGDVLAKGVGWRTPFPEIDLEVGDDGKIHALFTGSTKSNPRPSKTHIEYVIQGNYGYGWDDENTELTRADAKRSLGEYRANGQGSYRLIRRRVKNDATNPGPTAKEAALLKMMQDDYVRARRAYDERRFDANARALRTKAVKARIRLRGWWRAINHKYKLGLFKNPHDPRTAPTVRIPAVVRASIPAASGDPRHAETRRLRVVRVGARSNPAIALKLSSATWRRLPKRDRRARGSIRFVRCKTSKRGAAHWLRCVVR